MVLSFHQIFPSCILAEPYRHNGPTRLSISRICSIMTPLQYWSIHVRPGAYINIPAEVWPPGPDENIYVSDYPNTWLHVIDAPNEAGPACNFLWKGLDISPGESGLGMPTMPAGYWRPHAPWLSGQRQPRSCASSGPTPSAIPAPPALIRSGLITAPTLSPSAIRIVWYSTFTPLVEIPSSPPGSVPVIR